MAKKNKGIVAIVGVMATLFFLGLMVYGFGLFQFSVIRQYSDEGSPLDDSFKSGSSLCSAALSETVASFDSGEVILAECRACPNGDRKVAPSCNIGCSETCPEGASCSRPLYCENGGCAATGSCNGRPCSCSPTDRSYFESWAQGCQAGYTVKGYAYILIAKGEDAAFEEKKFSDLCLPTSQLPLPVVEPPVSTTCLSDLKACNDGSFVGKITPNCDFAACPDEPEVEPVENPVDGTPSVEPSPTVCSMKCEGNFAADYANCRCVPTTKYQSDGSVGLIPKNPFFKGNVAIGIVGVVGALASLLVTVGLSVRK